ncbi:MAG: PRD domain-containing protein [Erysipelotrichaceae bacterium]|nr:PRD domain-containing protein [Erysipelotrichaceae bacterium]
MKVVKVLNNSLMLALNDNGEEVILMGKGIGYKKAIGEEVSDDQIEKIFECEDKKLKTDIMRLAVDTNSIYFEVSKEIIDYAIEKYNMQLMDYLYLSLTDHICFCIQRFRQGINIPNYYVRDIKNLNPNEYDVAKNALNIIRERLEVDLPNDEIGNIAFHFINAQKNHLFSENNIKMQNITNNILNIVKLNFNITYDENEFVYSRFVTHVQLLAKRVIDNKMLKDEDIDILFEKVNSVCQREEECVNKIDKFLNQIFGISLTKQERLYLEIHIHRILESYK